MNDCVISTRELADAMQFNTFVSSYQDIERCIQAPNLHEVLLEPVLLARQGRLSDDEVQELALRARHSGLRTVLVWDALMPERTMQQVSQNLAQWDLSLFDAVRVSDPGAAGWLQIHHPQKPLQLIVETGNHNLAALRGWCEIFSTTLERFILSIELTEEKLVEYCKVFLPVECELLGVGSILLFYSPRSLLAQHLTDQNESYLEATVAPEDMQHRQFPTVETQHGTFMFLDKDQFILHRLDALKTAGLHSVRLDLRHLSKSGNDSADNIDQICQQALTDPALLRKNWPRKTHAPFFKTNKTTVSFERIKPKMASYRDEHCLAEIVSAEKGKYLVFYTLRSFLSTQAKTILLPSGEYLDIPADFRLQHLNGELGDSFAAEQVLVTSWMKKAVAGSLLLADYSGTSQSTR